MARSRRTQPTVPTVLQWNVNALRPRRAELSAYLLQHTPDAVALQESYVRAGDGSGFKLPGYTGYHSPTACDSAQCSEAVCGDPSHPPGASRASLYARSDVRHAVVDTSAVTTSVQECVAVTLRLGAGGDVTVCSVYVRPRQPWGPSLLDQLVTLCAARHLLCGDYNAHHFMWGECCCRQ